MTKPDDISLIFQLILDNCVPWTPCFSPNVVVGLVLLLLVHVVVVPLLLLLLVLLLLLLLVLLLLVVKQV